MTDGQKQQELEREVLKILARWADEALVDEKALLLEVAPLIAREVSDFFFSQSAPESRE